MPEFITAAKLAELPPGAVKAVELKGVRLALFNIDGQIYATQETCTHADASLADGVIEGCDVICPWHGARFDVTSGHATCGPAYGDLATFPVRITDDVIEVEI